MPLGDKNAKNEEETWTGDDDELSSLYGTTQTFFGKHVTKQVTLSIIPQNIKNQDGEMSENPRQASLESQKNTLCSGFFFS